MLFLFSTKKEEKCTKKTLTFQMQRWKTDSFNTAEHQDTQYYKRINMEDSQRQTWRTKTWFYPRFKHDKRDSLQCILVFSTCLSGEATLSNVSIRKPLTLPCPEPRPALFSSWGGGDAQNHVAGPKGKRVSRVDDWAITEKLDPTSGSSRARFSQPFHCRSFSFRIIPRNGSVVRTSPQKATCPIEAKLFSFTNGT